jgi:hypothetical protein
MGPAATRRALRSKRLRGRRLKLPAGGPVQPVKVCTLFGAVAGKAGLKSSSSTAGDRACLEPGIPVLAWVQQHMKDAHRVVAMER